ncbi:MAG: hypothetical protein KDC90_02235 [Ignavibacteriae bacterium]|nr:hypothetical protein [Ignavibacteriota bacterium]
MAVVKGNVLGNLSGKLGNLSARTVQGRTVLSARPSSFAASQDPDSIAVRQKFAVTANFSKNVLSIPILESIWNSVKSQKITAFNAIFKNNFQFSTVDRPTDQNIITPGGFLLPVSSAVVGANDVTVELTALNDATVIKGFEEDVSFAAMVINHNPISEEDAPFSIITLSKDVDTFDFANPYTLTMALHASETTEAAKYQDSILLLAAATKDDYSKVVQYSKTFAQ